MRRYTFPHNAMYLEHEKSALKRHPLFLGIELEVAHESYCHNDYCDCEGCYEGECCEYSESADYPQSSIFTAGYDCSIEPGGYEFRTSPISWEYARAHIDVVGKWLKGLEEFEFFTGSAGNCGMHVHLNRGVLLPYQTYKLTMLFKNNVNKIHRFSRRSVGNFHTWSTLQPIEGLESRAVVIENAKNCKDRGSFREGRGALSFCRGDTVEFRAFNGTLDPTIFWGNVEFVVATYRFSRDNRLSDMNFDKLAKYVKSNKSEYKHLHETLDVVFDQSQDV